MTQIDFHFIAPDGSPISNGMVEVRLSDAAFRAVESGVVVPRVLRTTTDDQGRVSLDLWPVTTAEYTATALDPASGARARYQFYVPESEVPVRLQDLVMVPPPSPKRYDEAAIQAIQDERILSQDAASTAQNASSSAGVSAQTASTAASTAQNASSSAQSAQAGAETAQVAAETARDLAQQYRDTTQTYRDTTLGHRDAAETARDLSQQYRDASQAWAETAEDVEVATGQYSSFHHRAKSEQAQAASEAARDDAQALYGDLSAIDEAVLLTYTNRAYVDTAITTNLVILEGAS